MAKAKTGREQQFEEHLHWAGQIADDYVGRRKPLEAPYLITDEELRMSLRQAAFLGACNMLQTLKMHGQIKDPYEPCEETPESCECDNTHDNNDTVCRYCWDVLGRRKPNDPYPSP